MRHVDFKEYVAEKLRQGCKTGLYVKTAVVRVRRGCVGEKIITETANGLTETVNTVRFETDVIVVNPAGEEYIVNEKDFAERYERDAENPELYHPKNDAQRFLFLEEDVRFTACSGEIMTVRKGGVLNITDLEKGYGIQEKEFEETYAPVQSVKIF